MIYYEVGFDHVVHALPQSLSLNERNTVIYTSEMQQQRESKDQNVLTGRKLAIEKAVMTTSQHDGVASSIWTNKTRSFAAAWWLSNNSLANTDAGPNAENDVDWSWISCTQRWRDVAGGWWGAAARCMVTLLPDRMFLSDDSAKNFRIRAVTFWKVVCHLFSTMYMHCNNNNVWYGKSLATETLD